MAAPGTSMWRFAEHELGAALLALERPQEAATLFQELLDQDANDEGAIQQLASALQQLHRTEEAVGLLTRSVARMTVYVLMSDSYAEPLSD